MLIRYKLKIDMDLNELKNIQIPKIEFDEISQKYVRK